MTSLYKQPSALMNLGPLQHSDYKAVTFLKADPMQRLQTVPHSHDLGYEMFLAVER